MERNGKYYLTDQESGLDYEVNEYTHKQFEKLNELIRPVIKDKTVGHITVLGTGGEIVNDDLAELFYNPTSFDTL